MFTVTEWNITYTCNVNKSMKEYSKLNVTFIDQYPAQQINLPGGIQNCRMANSSINRPATQQEFLNRDQ